MTKTLIVGGGVFPHESILFKVLENIDYIIAADRGYDYLYKNGVEPHFLIGDFDSINSEKPISKNIRIEKYNPEKSMTDLEIAIEKSLELGSDEVLLLGCTGTRLDHTFMNVFLLNKFLIANVNAMIIDDHNEIIMVNYPINLDRNGYKYFSIIPLSDETTITIKNGKYELDGYNVKFANSITISNEFINNEVDILVNKKVLIFKSRD